MSLMGLEALLRQTNFQNNSDLRFQFKLAEKLGMTVSELRSKMPLKEYNQWIMLYTLENEERNKELAMAEAERIKRG